MIYNCGHKGCDVCGRRECDLILNKIKSYWEYNICEYCLKKAIKLAIDMAESFRGTIIYMAKPCGKGN